MPIIEPMTVNGVHGTLTCVIHTGVIEKKQVVFKYVEQQT